MSMDDLGIFERQQFGEFGSFWVGEVSINVVCLKLSFCFELTYAMLIKDGVLP